MPNTFSQVYLQIVFAVKGRRSLIARDRQPELNKYISGIITAKGQKAIIVNGMPDHIHCFVGLKPSMSISDLVRDIKNNSSRFINEQNWIAGKFMWQQGFGVFSYSQSHIERVYNYILNQETHHRKSSFKEEYLDLLTQYHIDYKPEYLFDWVT